MVSKAIISLFLASFAILQVNGCFNKDLMEEFMAFDIDKSGFITRDELCQIIIMHGGSGDLCKKAWNSFDLNKDGKVTCQESFVGALALDEKNMERDFADQLKIMFADKPDNCEEVAKEDLDNLIAIDRNNGEEAEEATLEEIHGSIDVNQDGIFTCNEILENLFKALLYQNQNSKFHQ